MSVSPRRVWPVFSYLHLAQESVSLGGRFIRLRSSG